MVENVEEQNSILMTTSATLPSASTLIPLANVSWGAETTAANTEDEEDITGLATEVVVLATIGLSILILVGIAGNVMTIFAYFEDRKHNKVYDFFILNLAITDLILCSVCMPFHAVYILMDLSWPLGYLLCKVWLTIEYTACTEATLLILILSLDRLLMISLGTLYMQTVTWKRAKTVLGISWIASLIHYAPAIIGWNHFVGYSTVPHMDCDVEFAYENAFVITMIIIEFVIPFVSLTIINGLLLFKVWRWANIRKQASNASNASTDRSKERQKVLTFSSIEEFAKQVRQCGNLIITVAGVRGVRSVPDNSNPSTQQTNTGTGSERNRSGPTGRRTILKSAKFLASLVLAFLFFWLPHEIMILVIAICNSFCISNAMYECFLWLLLTKSVVNPFLYAFNSPRYRRSFRRYITLNGRIWKAESIH